MNEKEEEKYLRTKDLLKQKWDIEEKKKQIGNERWKLQNKLLELGHQLALIENQLRSIFDRQAISKTNNHKKEEKLLKV